MKISIFTDTLCDTNGVSRFLQDLSFIASRKSIDLHVHTATVKPCERLSSHMHIYPPSCRIKMPFYPQLDLAFLSSKRVHAIFDHYKPDIVHISTPGPIGWVAKREAKKRKIPLVSTYHTDFPAFLYEKTKSKLIKNLTSNVMKKFYEDFNLILTRSTFYHNALVDELGIDKNRIHTLKAGIDLSKFHPDFKKNFRWSDFGVEQEGIKVLYVGRLSEEKRISLLLDAWSIVGENYRASLILVGEADERIRKRLSSLPNTFYLGKRVGLELAFLYAASDLFVTPSITETLGQTIIEAMASALPLIVADRGGHRDYVEGSFASIISSDDPKVWAKEIMKLSQDREKRAAMGTKGREKALSMSIESSFEDFIEVHRSFTSFSKTP